MGWQIKRKTVKKETQYRIWCSSGDEYITKWLTKDGVLKYLFWYRFDKFMSDFLKDAMTFPNEYLDKDTDRRIMDDDSITKYYEFMLARYRNNDKSPEVILGEKFEEIINKLGIDVSVKDSDGYEF